MYSGTMLFFVGAPLLLGSWWGVGLSPLFAVLFAVRIAARTARGPARLCRLHGSGTLPAGARTLVRAILRPIATAGAQRCPVPLPTLAAAIAAWCGSNAPPTLPW